MADTTAPYRSNPESTRPPQAPTKRQYPFVIATFMVFLLIVAGTIGYSIGWRFSQNSIDDLKNKLAAKSVDYDKKDAELQQQKTDNASLIKDLSAAKAKLDEVFQSTRQIKLAANQSQRVSVGDFTVGLATGLGSGSIGVSVNGKKLNMAAASQENLTFAFNCVILLQSFDVLQSSATFNTSCSPVKAPDTTAQPQNPATK